MKVLKKIAIWLIVIVLVLGGIGLLLPKTYRVERSVVVKAEPHDVYAQVNTLKKWPEWTAWTMKKYPDMQIEFKGPEAGEGAEYYWTGKSTGKGNLKLTKSDPAKGVEYRLDFEDGKYVSDGSIFYEPAGAGEVKVTWVNSGDLGWNPVNRYFGLMMDRFMGPDFEEGLGNLKQRVETKDAK